MFFLQAMEEFSILWLLLSSIIGGVISLFLKYLFDEQITYYVRNKRQIEKVIKDSTRPLLNDAYALERRVNNIIRNIEEDWFEQSNYYELTTLYLFTRLFSRLYIIDKKFGYVEYSTNSKSHDFNKNIRKIYFSLTSFKLFKDIDGHDTKGLRRMTITAIGELGTKEEGGLLTPLTLIEFQRKYKELTKYMWFNELISFIKSIYQSQECTNFDRIIVLGKALHELCVYLDTQKILVRNHTSSNINRLNHKKTLVNYAQNFEKTN